MSEKRIYTAEVGPDDSVVVYSVAVVKETPQYHYIEPKHRGLRWDDPEYKRRDAFGYSDRVPKTRFYATERDAVEAFMEWRQHRKSAAQTEIGRLTKQIASANELLMRLSRVPA